MSTTAYDAPARIDPRKVMKQRRKLQFSGFPEILEEATRLSDLVDGTNSVREDLAGPEVRIVHLANLPLGQMLGHLGLTLSLALKESEYRFPLPMRLVMGMMRGRFLSGGIAMPVEAPAGLNRAIQPEPWLDAASGLQMLQDNIDAFEAADSYQPNLMLGRLSRDEWIQLTCRHAEWHLGFILER